LYKFLKSDTNILLVPFDVEFASNDVDSETF
jgi:hypothetical protein